MALQINYLCVEMTIGGRPIQLKSDPVAELTQGKDKAKQSLAKRMKKGLAFKMEKGEKISFSMGDFLQWIQKLVNDGNKKLEEKGGAAALPSAELPEMLAPKTNETGSSLQQTLNGIKLDIWNVSFSTTFEFGAIIKVSLTKDFYDGLGIPDAVTSVFTLDSITFGIEYSRPTMEEMKGELEDAATKEKAEADADKKKKLTIKVAELKASIAAREEETADIANDDLAENASEEDKTAATDKLNKAKVATAEANLALAEANGKTGNDLQKYQTAVASAKTKVTPAS